MASSWIVCVLTVLLVVRWTSADGFTASTLDWLAGSKGATEAPSGLGRPVVCPAQCDCFNYRETVDCSRRNLERVPASLPPVVRRLYLEGNRIEELGGDGRLSAAGNDSVPPQTSRLSAAGNLSVLIVEDNRLTELNVDALCRLGRLQELDASGNQIQTIVTVGRCGARLSALKELNLDRAMVRRPSARRGQRTFRPLCPRSSTWVTTG